MFKKFINAIGRIFFLFAIAVVILFVAVFVGLHIPEHKNIKKNYGDIPSYQIVEKKKYDAPVKAQYVLRVVVSGNVTKQSLKNLLNKLYDSVKDDHSFKYHKRPTNIYIFIYATKKQFEKGYLYLARLDKSGDRPPKIDINNNLFTSLKTGLNTEKRMKIWNALLIAISKADKEAKKEYEKNKTKSLDKIEKEKEELYKKQVAQEYGITKKQMKEILSEGVDKGWPYPMQN